MRYEIEMSKKLGRLHVFHVGGGFNFFKYYYSSSLDFYGQSFIVLKLMWNHVLPSLFCYVLLSTS